MDLRLRTWTAALVALSLCACHVPPPVHPECEQQPAPPDEPTDIDAEVEASTPAAPTEMERKADAELQAATDALTAARAAVTAAEAERFAYETAVAEAQSAASGCSAPPERLIELVKLLREYAADPARDAAIAGLEPCRKAALGARKKHHDAEHVGRREAFARALEAAYDETHPADKGHMVAAIKAEALQVALTGSFELRPQQAQAEVDGWCAQAPYFAEISLRNAHGTFKCRPEETPAQYTARLLREDGLTEPWSPAPVGSRPGPRDDSALARLRADVTAAEQRLAAATADERNADEYAQSIAAERSEQAKVQEKEQQRLDHESYREGNRMLIAGFALTGGMLVSGGFAIAYSVKDGRVKNGATAVDSEAEKNALHKKYLRNEFICLGVTLVAAVSAAVLLHMGRSRRGWLTRLQPSPGGLALRF